MFLPFCQENRQKKQNTDKKIAARKYPAAQRLRGAVSIEI
jgi:hypothetical protein